jgi:5-(carboxyamino)imidazole ribonucleotide synthase
MEKFKNFRDIKLGIIAGGQLGKMLIQAASKWDITCYVLDKDVNCCCSSICKNFYCGDPDNFEDVYNFGKKVDILTYEIEHINIDALKKLKNEGLPIYPDPSILAIIQDKGQQKTFFKDHDIPTANFKLYCNKEEILQDITSNKLVFPFVQKLRRGGYDGRAVVSVNKEEEISDLFDGPTVVERKIDIKKELSIIASRNPSGQIISFPAVEMVFNRNANILDSLISPADIQSKIEIKAEKIAHSLIELLDIVGLLAVEFLLDKNDNLFVNEVAPRPHNSGHHTIEANYTSQFEQHLRAILNLPVGNTRVKSPAVMFNLLGEENFTGSAVYEGFEEALEFDRVYIHIYGKNETFPYRKMGHITVLSDTIEEATQKAIKLKKLVRVKSKQ